ncbi:uncharacterized protein LOC121808440 [Salvia splendens]|uniref:uncharacterized protein LOC121808440 n=1 Tax=Salvia splendens TaxID=180675 RepID=UPI001C27DDA7|nr:uncharacterized protein LOC121808440 [Salvia splendens]
MPSFHAEIGLFVSQFEFRIVRAASEDHLVHELGKRWTAGATSFLYWTPGHDEKKSSCIAEKMFGIDSRELNAPSEESYPKGQLERNTKRLADVVSDASNFQSFIMMNFGSFSNNLSTPSGEFVSGWCSSNILVCEEDAPLKFTVMSCIVFSSRIFE